MRNDSILAWVGIAGVILGIATLMARGSPALGVLGIVGGYILFAFMLVHRVDANVPLKFPRLQRAGNDFWRWLDK